MKTTSKSKRLGLDTHHIVILIILGVLISFSAVLFIIEALNTSSKCDSCDSCGDNGHCKNNKCVCNNGYTGTCCDKRVE
jgi:hypothetical protein